MRTLVAIAAVSLFAQFAPPPRVLDTSTAIAYFIATGESRVGYRDSDMELARWALEAWQRAASGALVFQASDSTHALVRVHWVHAAGGQYGEMQPFFLGGRPGAAVYVRPDVNGLGADVVSRVRRDPLMRDVIVYLTCLHELGHALGLSHTRDLRDVMYFFGYGGDVGEYFQQFRQELRGRRDLASVELLSDGDRAQLRSLYPLKTR